MKKKKVYDDDDGRTIADMSMVERPKSFGSDLFPSDPPGEKRKDDLPPVDKDVRRAYVLSALLAALAIGAAFALGLGLVIWLMTALW